MALLLLLCDSASCSNEAFSRSDNRSVRQLRDRGEPGPTGGHCRHCLGGWETLCESQLNTGYSVNGGFADYVVADPNYIGYLPKNVDFMDIAPVLCAGVTVYKGLKVTLKSASQRRLVILRSAAPSMHAQHC